MGISNPKKMEQPTQKIKRSNKSSKYPNKPRNMFQVKTVILRKRQENT